MDIGGNVALMLVALIGVVVLGASGLALVVVIVRGFEALRKAKDMQTPTERFNADAQRLHRLMHPDEDDEGHQEH